MSIRPRHRLAMPELLEKNRHIDVTDNAAHYLTHVLRLGVGDAVALFNGAQGEWLAELAAIRKKHATLVVKEKLRDPQPPPNFWACFALVKAGRLETMLEKATELGARVIQPVITARTIVDKLNLERGHAIVREAAEQCERTDWPELRAPVKLTHLLGNWPADRTLVYGDESGASAALAANDTSRPASWATLTGPEGGFTHEEFSWLQKTPGSLGVGLGPRILRADTAMITLSALMAARWGDWNIRPHFKGDVHEQPGANTA